MWRRSIVFIVITVILFTVGVSALSGVDSHWAGQYAIALNKMGIFNGDDNGDANLSDDIRRSEFLALLVRAVYSDKEITRSNKGSFIDVDSNSWYYDIASFAKEEGIVTGDEQGRLLPNDNIKREEIVLMLVRALELKGNGDASFTDINKDYVYYDAICAAVKSSIIKGYADGSFGPKNNATRGEAAAMIARMLGVEVDEETPPASNTDISGKINMTWHHFGGTNVTSTGDYMDGLNVISPTWFRIRSFTDEVPAPYEYKLDGDNIYYLQDLGNAQYMSEAKAKGYKVWALFKSNDFSAKNNSGFLNDENARKSAVSLMKQMIIKYDLDGINMDFENMLVTDKDTYTKFVKEMSEVTKELGVILSVDVTKYEPTGGTWSLCYDRKSIAEYADYIALMAYDQNGTSSTVAGSVGDMPWVENALKKTLNEVPPEKVLLGVPFYTRLWQSKNGVVVKTSAIDMATAQNKIAQAGAQIVYDAQKMQNYAKWESDGVTFEIWLEDETSMKARLDLVKKYALAGVASWSKGFENKTIWTFIKENLNE